MSLKAKLIVWILRGVPKDGIRRKIFMAEAKPEIDKYLKEDNDMEGKSMWQSKAVWTAIVGVVLGAVQPISTALGHPVIIPAYIYEVLAGFGLYALRDGVGKPLQ